MSEFFFGVSTDKPTREDAKTMDRVAHKHGAYLVEYVDPGTRQYKRWFATRNRGNPFDQATANAVLDELRALRVLPP